ncbi:MAG TPA: hypothetical protein VK720_12165 [Terracidiphilus sp.]|jgi:hypothetical protein|nr:hypothetical protein [Terracidiphilus sp.]
MSIGMTNLDGALRLKVGTFLGRELIYITGSNMEIQTWFMGFMVGKRKFDAEQIHQVRYEEWKEKGVRTCGIRFKHDGKTHVLIKSTSESDTLRAVVKIINVYKFSHNLAASQTELSNTA